MGRRADHGFFLRLVHRAQIRLYYAALSCKDTDQCSLHRSSGFNEDITSWDMSSATNTERMFLSATKFNQNIAFWDMSSVGMMKEMFESACDFNQLISFWDTSNVHDMPGVFCKAYAFSQPLTWDVSQVTNMRDMFRAAKRPGRLQ